MTRVVRSAGRGLDVLIMQESVGPQSADDQVSFPIKAEKTNKERVLTVHNRMILFIFRLSCLTGTSPSWNRFGFLRDGPPGGENDFMFWDRQGRKAFMNSHPSFRETHELPQWNVTR